MFAYRLPYSKNIHSDWETLEFMRDIGVDVIVLSPMNTRSASGVPYSDYPPIWRHDEAYDYSTLDTQIGDILSRHPKARLLSMIDLNSPEWLARRYRADSFNQLTELAVNPEWRRLTLAYLKAFVNHCETHHGNHMLGYIPCCGGTLEWLEPHNVNPGVFKSLRYASYCRERNWPELPIPDYATSARSDHGFIRDPEREAATIQFRRYVNSLEADFAIEVVTDLRRQLPPERRIGMFYSYVFGLDSNGHADFERAFDAAPPDFVIGASCNCDRESGHAGGYAAMRRSLERRGITFLHEIDRITDTTNLQLSPYTACVGPIWKRWDTPQKAAAGLKREMAMSLIQNFSLWWFNIWGFSYRSPEVRDALRRMAQIWRDHAGKSSGSAAEILLVCDLESNSVVNTVNTPEWPREQSILGHRLRNALSEAGFGCDNTLWSDLGHMELAQYRLIIFQNPTLMTEERKRFLEEKVLRDHRIVAWGLAPGVVWEGSYTGTPVHFAPGEFTEFRPADPAELNAEKIRELATLAGVHRYADGCAAWASGEYLVLHRAGSPGKVAVTLAAPACEVRELFAEKTILVDGQSFTDEFAAVDTKLYHIRSMP